jgi:hypothetical protein
MVAPSSRGKPMRRIDNWKSELHRLWSVRTSIAFGVFTTISEVMAAFTDVFNPWFLRNHGEELSSVTWYPVHDKA